MKTKLTLFVAVLFANCLLAVELPDGVSKDSKDLLVQAFIKTKGDIVAAINLTSKHAYPRAKCDSEGRLVEVQLNDLKGVGNEGMILLTQVPSIRHLFVAGTSINNEGLKLMTKLQHLTYIHIASCPITDIGLSNFHKIPNLRTIYMYNCKDVTNEGLKHLSVCPKLANVNINGLRKVDGDGLKHLLKLTAPNSIEASGTGITLSDAKAYMTKKPDAKVFLK